MWGGVVGRGGGRLLLLLLPSSSASCCCCHVHNYNEVHHGSSYCDYLSLPLSLSLFPCLSPSVEVSQSLCQSSVKHAGGVPAAVVSCSWRGCVGPHASGRASHTASPRRIFLSSHRVVPDMFVPSK